MKVNYKFVFQWFDGYLKWTLTIIALGMFVVLISSSDKDAFIRLSLVTSYLGIFGAIPVNFFYQLLGE